ncbi:MAG: hypothetical protein V7K15_14140 [Nostoc sp.]
MPVVDGETLQSRSDRLIFSTTTASFRVEAFSSKTTRSIRPFLTVNSKTISPLKPEGKFSY